MKTEVVMRTAFVLLCVLSAGTGLVGAGDAWDRFRGPDGAGVDWDAEIPLNLSLDEHLKWRVDLAPGTSSPILVDSLLFVTSFQDDDRSIHCIDAATGKTKWTKSVQKDHFETATPPANPATPSVAADGERVFAFFPDTGVFAWSIDGESLWESRSSASSTMHGLSSSLICCSGNVIQVVDQLNDSLILARNAETGEVAWRQERVSGLTGAYATPVVYVPETGRPQILVTGPLELVAYDAVSGDRVWWVMGNCNAPVSSPILRGNTLYICEPVGEPIPMSMVAPLDKDQDGKLTIEETKDNIAIGRLVKHIDLAWGNGDQSVDEAEWDKAFGSFAGKGGLLAIRIEGAGDQTENAVRWSYRKSLPYIPGVMVHNQTVFAVNDGGLVSAIDAATGEELHKGRLRKGTGKYYASPVATASAIFTVDTAGVLNVLSPEPEYKTLATVELNDACYATPAISGDCLFVRTEKSLICFGKK